MTNLLRKYAGHLQASEMLAVSAHMIGMIIALQDQRTMTRERAMDILIKNLEAGNRRIIENISNTKGNA
ncbi:hypothetical protein P106B_62 [Rhizobium phage vB_RglS_P106B]|uniref:Uncharacterized protein n=1 Tax=Rhizobium phage vB_RglS_P106B TaxID=1458697 RepID=W6E8H9_9CAUD|nr:hypothetical protein P106B_62 [Rhizobium phage vB_RglS_P106B]AHJ10745.1 hypothetical protein P106B_62 [Rhizobium phage vB_RglS_P106B]